VPDLLSGLEAGVHGKRIGWLGDWGGAYPMEPGILEACEGGLRVLEDLGAVVEVLAPPFPAEKLWLSWVTLRAMLNAGGKRALAEEPAKRALTKPETLWEIEQGSGLSAAQVHEASVIRSDWYRQAARMFARFDAVVLPTAQVWPFPADWRWPQDDCGQDNGHLSPLDGGGGASQPDRPAGPVGAAGLRRGRAAGGDADHRPVGR
jgi:amidase